MKRVLLSPAYVLHRRAYRETSLLIDLFTPDHGRLSVIAKGVRKPRSTQASLLQPFVPLLVSWTGKTELLTLMHVEMNGGCQSLRGECLFAGFYLNELLVALLQKWDPHPEVYTLFEQTLVKLNDPTLPQGALRTFEKQLLEALGYGFFPPTALLSDTFVVDQYYRFIPEEGFVKNENNLNDGAATFLGKSLIGIAKEAWHEGAVLHDAKRLIRLVLAPLLGNKRLHSRRLFTQPTHAN
ncbi:MAG: DNA repair protein RecO [Gammaproteobacteria bacterium]|nr:DNA repair protein RecO [Gammaproteobacteria bacterium]